MGTAWHRELGPHHRPGANPGQTVKEPLIYSGRSRLEGEVCSFKAQIAGNSCSIAKICNDKAAHFSPKMHVHE